MGARPSRTRRSRYQAWLDNDRRPRPVTPAQRSRGSPAHSQVNLKLNADSATEEDIAPMATPSPPSGPASLKSNSVASDPNPASARASLAEFSHTEPRRDGQNPSRYRSDIAKWRNTPQRRQWMPEVERRLERRQACKQMQDRFQKRREMRERARNSCRNNPSPEPSRAM